MNFFPVLLVGIIALFCSTSTVSSSNDNTWAVLICGLDIYQYTYGMEAAVYKMYNMLINRGIPAKNIIVISPDSAAFNLQNPFPGLVAHAVTGSPENNVNFYANVSRIDYDNKSKLTADQFFAVLSGNASALNQTGSGRVIKSGPKDTVLIYYVGYGAYGVFYLNNNVIIWADKFIDQLEQLQEKKRIGKIYINMETEAAGSMFDDLIESKNIIARSLGGRQSRLYLCHKNELLEAFTSTCSSYLHLYALEATLKQNYKGDVNLNDEFMAGRSLASISQFFGVHNLYGNLNLGREKLNNYFGTPKSKSSETAVSDSESQVQAHVQNAKRQIKRGIPIKKALYEDESVPPQQKEFLKDAFREIVSKSIEETELTFNAIQHTQLRLASSQYDCYRNAVEATITHCGTNENKHILLMHTDVLAKLCIQNVSDSKITKAAKNICRRR